MTYFRYMTERQAAIALAECLAERPAALHRLRDELASDGADPDTLLDGTPESLTPLWRWVATRIMGLEDDPTPVPRDAPAPPWWPSWARYTADLRRSTPDEVVTLLDGFVSYLADVLTAGAPEAVWQVGRHRIKAYVYYHHPVLAGPDTDDDSQLHLPELVTVEANIMRHRGGPLRADRITGYATAVITELRGEKEPVPVAEEEPLVEVQYEDGVFDVGLHEEIAHEHSRMVKDLAAQPGITSAHREDREVLLVTAPDWDSEQLERWVTDWLKARIPELG